MCLQNLQKCRLKNLLFHLVYMCQNCHNYKGSERESNGLTFHTRLSSAKNKENKIGIKALDSESRLERSIPHDSKYTDIAQGSLKKKRLMYNVL